MEREEGEIYEIKGEREREREKVRESKREIETGGKGETGTTVWHSGRNVFSTLVLSLSSHCSMRCE